MTNASSSISLIEFHGDTLFAMERDGQKYVAVKPISDALGLDWSGQRQRINRDPVLSEGAGIIPLPYASGKQETTCLRLDLLNGWLFGVDLDRIKDPETRERVLIYKRECYAVLHEHFMGEARIVNSDTIGAAKESDASKLRKVAEARLTFGTRAAQVLWISLGLDNPPGMLADPRQMEIPLDTEGHVIIN